MSSRTHVFGIPHRSRHNQEPSNGSDASTNTNISSLANAIFLASKISTVWSSKVPHRVSTRKRALLVGICQSADPESFAHLQGPWKDVRDFARVLQDYYNFPPENIIVMLDAPGHPPHLQPTLENLKRELHNFVEHPIPGDDFVFHYSGHSDQQDCHDGTEEDNKDEVLITQDGQRIMDDDLHNYLVKPLIPGCSLVAVLDTCHSQSLLDLPHHRCNRFSKRTRMLRKATELLTPPPTPAALQEAYQPAAPTPETVLVSKGRISRSNTVTSVKREVSRFCRGTCHRIVNRNQPYVLCISACKDQQEAFDEVSMTSALLQVLEENRRPTLGELIRQTSTVLADRTKEMDDEQLRIYYSRYRRWIATQTFRKQLLLRVKPIPHPLRRRLPDPQLSSLSPLFLKDHLSL